MTRMFDPFATIRAFLLRDDALKTLVGERIESGDKDQFESAYSPMIDPQNADTGPALLFNIRGGTIHETSMVQHVSVQFLCYGADTVTATAVAVALFAAANEQRGPGVLFAYADTPPQLLPIENLDWRCAVTFYTFHLQGAS